MDSNYLHNLFINEVKGALNRGGGSGGSGGNAKIPTKLSELENDLFYSKREEFLTLTKADFIPWAIPAGGIDYLYISSPKLDWLLKTDDIAWELSAVVDGESVVMNSDNVSTEVRIQRTDDGMQTIEYMGDMPFAIFSGFDYTNWNEFVGKDEFVVNLVYYDIVDELNLKIYRIESKKVPIEYCDITEIESAIDEINGEVI